MIKKSLLPVFLLLNTFTYSQYYYNDIIGTNATVEKMKTYTNNKVKSITGTGYDQRGTKTADFNEWQEINTTDNTLKISSRNGQQITRQTYQFNKPGQLTSITETSGGIKSTTNYTYSGNNITRILTTTTDSLRDFNETDDHQWSYDNAGKAQKMYRILNGKDSTEYRFVTDEKGNIGEEQLIRRGVAIDPVYYYYDDDNNLTDVVRYNKKVKQLLPDFMLEYDEQNRVIQKTITLSTTTPDYITWRYIFNTQGLKTKEALFNKQKELTGRIEYNYTFIQ